MTAARLSFFNYVWRSLVLRLLYATAVPVILLHRLWFGTFVRGVPRAWDGAGHYAAALLYLPLFPDTFGYISAYLGGMPFPNNYPPLMFFSIALLNRLGIPFNVAFKIVACAPELVIPPLIYLLAWKLSRRNASVAFWSTAVVLLVQIFPLSIVPLSSIAGIDYVSTFVAGMYSQLLGFVTFLIWLLIYNCSALRPSHFFSQALLLSCTLLSSFFNALTAVIFISSTLLFDLVRIACRPPADTSLRQETRLCYFHLLTPVIAVLMAAFWLVPAITTSDLFVTRPSGFADVTIFGWLLRFLSVIGAVLMFRSSDVPSKVFALSWFVLFSMVLLGPVAPRWLPFQAHRFSATANILSALPVGTVAAVFMRKLDAMLARFGLHTGSGFRTWVTWMGLPVLCLLSVHPLASMYSAGILNYSFYPKLASFSQSSSSINSEGAMMWFRQSQQVPSSLPPDDDFGASRGYRDIIGVLKYAREHPDGIYFVAFPYGQPNFEARALQAYLGSQGEKSFLSIYREATPSSIFFYPQMGALSVWSDNYGISATLAEDTDFLHQSLATHIERLKFLGVRYFVTDNTSMKERLQNQPDVHNRISTATWSIFELGSATVPLAEPLKYYPALFVGETSVKMRTSTQLGFVRLAEEQFLDNWFEVPLIRSPELNLDSVSVGTGEAAFSAMIIQEYQYHSIQRAYDFLRQFSQKKPLILFPSNADLFHLIRGNLSLFPHAHILDYPLPEAPLLMNSDYGPKYSFEKSAIRHQWRCIREILDREKTPVWQGSVSPTIQTNESPNRIQLTPAWKKRTPAVPVLLRRSFHPRWSSGDDDPVFAATPFFTVIYMRGPVTLAFERNYIDRLSLFGSGVVAALTIALWCAFSWLTLSRCVGRRLISMRLRKQ